MNSAWFTMRLSVTKIAKRNKKRSVRKALRRDNASFPSFAKVDRALFYANVVEKEARECLARWEKNVCRDCSFNERDTDDGATRWVDGTNSRSGCEDGQKVDVGGVCGSFLAYLTISLCAHPSRTFPYKLCSSARPAFLWGSLPFLSLLMSPLSFSLPLGQRWSEETSVDCAPCVVSTFEEHTGNEFVAGASTACGAFNAQFRVSTLSASARSRFPSCYFTSLCALQQIH